jgi:hypothetical protein
MAKRKEQRLKSPCGCRMKGHWRIIVSGMAPPPNWLWGTMFTSNDAHLSTPAYDPALKEWFLYEEWVLPDPDRDALICLECDEPTDGTIGFGDGLDENEVGLERAQAGLNPVWKFAWVTEKYAI